MRLRMRSFSKVSSESDAFVFVSTAVRSSSPKIHPATVMTASRVFETLMECATSVLLLALEKMPETNCLELWETTSSRDSPTGPLACCSSLWTKPFMASSNPSSSLSIDWSSGSSAGIEAPRSLGAFCHPCFSTAIARLDTSAVFIRKSLLFPIGSGSASRAPA